MTEQEAPKRKRGRPRKIKENIVKEGSVVWIPHEAKHRIENTSKENDLVFIGTQLGTYFGEDDITRIEDDYER